MQLTPSLFIALKLNMVKAHKTLQGKLSPFTSKFQHKVKNSTNGQMTTKHIHN